MFCQLGIDPGNDYWIKTRNEDIFVLEYKLHGGRNLVCFVYCTMSHAENSIGLIGDDQETFVE